MTALKGAAVTPKSLTTTNKRVLIMAAERVTERAGIVSLVDDKLITTSRQVAEVFGKAHSKVMRDIRELDCSHKFRESNFGVSKYYVNNQRRSYTEYRITKDGFVFLAMGFNGKSAAKFKEAYINEFNRMERMLKRPDKKPNIESAFPTVSGNIFGSAFHVAIEAQKLAFEQLSRQAEEVSIQGKDALLDWAKSLEIREKPIVLVGEQVSQLRDILRL